MPVDFSSQKIKTTMKIEKFDHTGDTPRLFERIIVVDGKVESKEEFPLTTSE